MQTTAANAIDEAALCAVSDNTSLLTMAEMTRSDFDAVAINAESLGRSMPVVIGWPAAFVGATAVESSFKVTANMPAAFWTTLTS